jgi:hypothetical protein
MPAVKFFARLDLDQICLFLDEHYLKPVADQAAQRCFGRLVQLIEQIGQIV